MGVGVPVKEKNGKSPFLAERQPRKLDDLAHEPARRGPFAWKDKRLRFFLAGATSLTSWSTCIALIKWFSSHWTIPLRSTTERCIYQFDVLQKKGYIRKTEVVQSENRPEKTIPEDKKEAVRLLTGHAYSSIKNDVEWLRKLPSTVLRKSEAAESH